MKPIPKIKRLYIVPAGLYVTIAFLPSPIEVIDIAIYALKNFKESLNDFKMILLKLLISVLQLLQYRMRTYTHTHCIYYMYRHVLKQK